MEANGAIEPRRQVRRVVVHTDGASRGNPGDAGIGWLILDESGKPVREGGRYIGVTTNNVAEYNALIEGLKMALEEGADEILVRSDSELMVRQVSGDYRVKNEGLLPLFVQARRLLLRFKRWRIEYVPREQNRRADALANRGIDRKVNKD